MSRIVQLGLISASRIVQLTNTWQRAYFYSVLVRGEGGRKSAERRVNALRVNALGV